MNAKTPAADLIMSTGAEAFYDRPELGHSGLDHSAIAASEPNPFAMGALVCHRYRVLSQLDSAGLTLLLHVRDERWQQETFETDLTIKVLRPELRGQPQWTQRLRREFEQTRLLRHPNIVRMHLLESHAGQAFIVMELLEGKSLAAELHDRKQPLPKGQVADILTACCHALSFAHARGIVHADLRPEHIFLTGSGNIRLMGFGSIPAQGLHLPMTEKESEAAYTSPQVVGSQRPDARDDIFSLSCIVHELLCGQPMQREISGGRVRCLADPRLPAAHREVLENAFAWRREDRPTDIGYLLGLLKPAEQPAVTTHGQAREPEIRSIPPAPQPNTSFQAVAGAVSPRSGITPEHDPPARARAAAPAVPEGSQTHVAAAAASAPIPAAHPNRTRPNPVPGAAALAPQKAVVATAPATTTGLRATSRSIPAHPPRSDATRARAAHPASANTAPSMNTPRGNATFTRPTDEAEHSAALRRWTIASALIAIGAVLWIIVDANRERQEVSRPAAVEQAVTPPAAIAADQSPAADVPRTPAPAESSATIQSEPVKTGAKPAAAVNSQRVAFKAASVTVSARAASAALTLLRSDGRDGRLRVDWRIKEGTAVAGRDFIGPSSGSVEFAHLQTVRSLYIPLQAHSSQSGARKFTVELMSASDGVLIAPNHAVTVTILDHG